MCVHVSACTRALKICLNNYFKNDEQFHAAIVQLHAYSQFKQMLYALLTKCARGQCVRWAPVWYVDVIVCLCAGVIMR